MSDRHKTEPQDVVVLAVVARWCTSWCRKGPVFSLAFLLCPSFRLFAGVSCCAGGGTRTHTPRREPDFESGGDPFRGPVRSPSRTSTGLYPAYLSPFSPFFPSGRRHYTRGVFGAFSPPTGSGCRQNCRQDGVGSEGDISTTLDSYSQVTSSLRVGRSRLWRTCWGRKKIFEGTAGHSVFWSSPRRPWTLNPPDKVRGVAAKSPVPV